VSVVFSLILANRTYSASLLRALFAPNLALAVVALFVVIVLTLTLALQPVRELFRFGALTGEQIALSLGAGAAALIALEGFKLIIGRDKRRGPSSGQTSPRLS